MWQIRPATGRNEPGRATASGIPPARRPRPGPHQHRCGVPASSRVDRNADRAATVPPRPLPSAVARARHQRVPRLDWEPKRPAPACRPTDQAVGHLIEPHRPPERSSRRTYAGHHRPVQVRCLRVFPQTAAGRYGQRRPDRSGDRFCPVRVVCLRHPGVAHPFPRHSSQSQSFQIRRRRKGRQRCVTIT